MRNDLRPFLKKQVTNMHIPVAVATQVTATVYYLSEEGSLCKTGNAVGLSHSVISTKVRSVC